MLIFDEFFYGKNKETDGKYFIGYKTSKKNGLLFITLSQMSRYLNKVEETQQVSLLIKDEMLLE